MDDKMLLMLLSQVVSVVVIIISNKVDLKWIIKIQEQHEGRLSNLERDNKFN